MCSYIPWINLALALFALLPALLWARLEGGAMEAMLGNHSNPELAASRLVRCRGMAAHYCLMKTFCEFLQLVASILSLLSVHLVLDRQFLLYGYEVYLYLFDLQPMQFNLGCHLFPPAMGCKVKTTVWSIYHASM